MRHKTKEEKQGAAVVFRTEFGWAGVAASEKGITAIALPRQSKSAAQRELAAYAREGRRSASTVPRNSRWLPNAEKLLRRYYAGEKVSFNLPLDLRIYTPFQRAVWKATAKIPSGQTRSYAWIARKIGRPTAVRAVGSALGANPVPVIVPCHRVISSSGALGGFSGGLGMKRKLLALETAKRKSFTAKP